jgi:UDP-N-acetylglucosamine acyltransferase
LIHPTALIGEPPEHRDWRHRTAGLYPEIAESAVIEAYCTVDGGVHEPTKIMEGAWLMKGCHVGHDAQVGADCELAPHTVLGGHVRLEEGVRCGIGVLLRPFITVGAGARLGAGAVVVSNVPAGEVWVGNPARRLYGVMTGEEMLTESEIEGWKQLAEKVIYE